MRKTGLTLAAVAALATTAVVNSPAEGRGGRNAAIGFGAAASVLGAAARKSRRNPGFFFVWFRQRLCESVSRSSIDRRKSASLITSRKRWFQGQELLTS
jgi:hypothetical protein